MMQEDRASTPVGRFVSAEERQRMIREAAYDRYVRRNFADGHALEDWLAAEAEVDERLRQSAGVEDEVAELAIAAT
jgi:hypothetical protein